MPPFCAYCGKDLEVASFEVARFCPQCGQEAFGQGEVTPSTPRSLTVYAAPIAEDAAAVGTTVGSENAAVAVGQPVAVGVLDHSRLHDFHSHSGQHDSWRVSRSRHLTGIVLIVLGVLVIFILPVSKQ